MLSLFLFTYSVINYVKLERVISGTENWKKIELKQLGNICYLNTFILVTPIIHLSRINHRPMN